MFEPEVFRKQNLVLKKVIVTLLGLFGARGIAPPLPPSLRLCVGVGRIFSRSGDNGYFRR